MDHQLDDSIFDRISSALVDHGYMVIDDILPIELVEKLLVRFDQLQAQEFKSAGIGRQTDFQRQETVRADKIHWISSTTNTTAQFLNWMDSLRVELNRRLFLGLFDYESHFAFYPVGAFYKKHLDAFRNKRNEHSSNRMLSTVLYLNKNWTSSSGGELIIYSEEGNKIVEKVSPVFGRVVIFLSEKFPHEVLPALAERKSIAGWFRVNESIN